MNGSRNSDVIVVGAGVVGVSVALHAMWRGLSVRIVERDRVGDGTSARGYGSVQLQSIPPDLLSIHAAGHAYYPEFIDRIGGATDFRTTGSMVLLESELQIEERRRLHDAQVAAVPGFQPAQILDARQARELEPNFSPHVVAASYRAGDSHFDPISMTARLAQVARDAGITLHEGARVQRMDSADGAWSVDTTLGTFSAGAIVNCAGVWSPEVAAASGAHLDVVPMRGQLLISVPRAPLCRSTMNLGSTGPFGSNADLRQRLDGRVLMGTVNETGSWDLSIRPEDTKAILAGAARAFPALQDIVVERAFAGLRGVPLDGFPYIGGFSGLPGQYVAVAHGGLSLGPVMGRAIVDLIECSSTQIPIRGCSPDRALVA